MKNLLLVLTILFVGGLCGYIGWRTGYSEGRGDADQFLRLNLETVAWGNRALDDLHQGHTENGIRSVERVTFLNLIALLEDVHWKDHEFVRALASELGLYLTLFHPDPELWSPTERRLSQLMDASEIKSQQIDDGNAEKPVGDERTQ